LSVKEYDCIRNTPELTNILCVLSLGGGMDIEGLEWVRTIDNVVSVFPPQVLSKIVISYIVESEIEFDHTKTEYVETNSRRITVLQFSNPYISVACKLSLMHSKKRIAFIHRGHRRCDVIVKLCTLHNNHLLLQNKFRFDEPNEIIDSIEKRESFVCIDFNFVLKKIITTEIYVHNRNKTYYKSISAIKFHSLEIEELLMSCVPQFEVGWFPQEIELVPDFKLDKSWEIKMVSLFTYWYSTARDGSFTQDRQ
jgi:hypothetical protein